MEIAKPRKKRPLPPPVFAPNRCVIVSVDPGLSSGWSIWTFANNQHALADFGECDVFAGGPQRVLEKAKELAKARGVDCVLIVERPFRVKFGSQTSIGTADKIWREMAKRMGFSKRVVRVYPNRWRASVLDRGWHKLKRDDVRKHEQDKAAVIVRGNGIDKHMGPDAAPAILIGRWAVYAGEVAAVLPKPRKKAA